MPNQYTRHPRTLTERFWSKVEKTEGCWLWRAGHSARGYGCFARTPTQICRAHRVAYELTYGPIPAGLYVCHHCDNRNCVRPDHLYLGTQHDNMRDRSLRDHHNAAKLTTEQVREMRAIYERDRPTFEALGAQFGVRPRTASRIARRKERAHVV